MYIKWVWDYRRYKGCLQLRACWYALKPQNLAKKKKSFSLSRAYTFFLLLLKAKVTVGTMRFIRAFIEALCSWIEFEYCSDENRKKVNLHPYFHFSSSRQLFCTRNIYLQYQQHWELLCMWVSKKNSQKRWGSGK
jgi:hypothetical protein